MLGPLINHESIVIVVDRAQHTCWLIQHFLNVFYDLVLETAALEQPETLSLVKHCLSRVLRQVNFGITDPLANLLLVFGFLIQIAENLSSLYDGHQTLLSLLGQVDILIITSIDKLLLDLGVG